LKIYVINLPQSFDRREHIQSQLHNNNTSFDFITGIDGKNLSPIEKNNLYDNSKAILYKRELTAGEIGCALSHKSIYKKMIEENIERAVIIEDDITLKPAFFDLLPYLNKLPIKNYIVKLERHKYEIKNDNNFKNACFTPWHRIKLTNKYFIGQPLYSPSSTLAYYIDILAARNLYSAIPKIFLVADAWWYYRKFVLLRMLNKAIVVNDEDIFHSVIGGRNFYADHIPIKKTAFNNFKKTIKDFIRMLFLFFDYSPTLSKQWKNKGV